MSEEPVVESFVDPAPAREPDPRLPNLLREVALPLWKVSGRSAHVRFALAWFVLVVSIVVTAVTGVPVVIAGLPVSWGLFLSAFVRATRAIREASKVSERPYEFTPRLWIAVFPFLGGGLMTIGMFWMLIATFAFSRGRQLRRFGKILLPPLAHDGAWAHLKMSAAATPELASALAARWRENGRTEHASVAAFARLTLDLMTLGAPPDLIHAANLDARDEIRHTELCFSLARALDGREESPGAFPEVNSARTLPSHRTLALARLAVDSLVDGALHEGLSARVIAQLAKRCEEPAIREVLLELAADEGRHAAHGWDVVEWCVAEGGAPVAEALLGAVTALPERVPNDLPEPARAGAWERFGIHGAALEETEYARARAQVCERVDRLARPALAA